MTNSRRHSFGQLDPSWLDRLIARVRFAQIRRLIPPNSRVLDLGCGYQGEHLRTLSPLIATGTGLDLSVNPRATSPHPHLRLIRGSVDVQLPLADASFDAVISLAVIEHVDHPLTMLREAYRTLRPGGRLLLTTPSRYGRPLLELLARLGVISRAEIDDHQRYYLPAGLRQALKEAGFRPAHILVRPFGILWLNILGVATK